MASVTDDVARQPNKMTFEVTKLIDDSTARLGRLKIGRRKDAETPNFFAIGSRGVVPHLTPDVISAHAKFGGIHMGLEDCKSSPTI